MNPQLTRRHFLKHSVHAISAAYLAQLGSAWGAATTAKAKSCIVLWMAGGPSQLDTFDPKTAADVRGEFSSIATKVPGIHISEHLPQTAKVMKELAIIRAMSSREGNHERATYLLHTGYAPQVTVQHPSLGAIVSYELGQKAAELPSFVSIGGPSHGPGFLGAEHRAFMVERPGYLPRNLSLAYGVDWKRHKARMKLLREHEDQFAAARGGKISEAREVVYDRANRLMGSKLTKVFDVEREPGHLRRRYGDSPFGRGCLVARRLVQAGVPFVEVNLPGWDTHQRNFDRTKQLSGMLDPAFASLITDLKQRRMLSETLVVWMGEFGRTPRINRFGGRDHFPRAWSAVVAGGGIRGGQVIGETSADGMSVTNRPVSVPDLFASFAHCLGLNAKHEFNTAEGRPITLVDKEGKPIRELFA